MARGGKKTVRRTRNSKATEEEDDQEVMEEEAEEELQQDGQTEEVSSAQVESDSNEVPNEPPTKKSKTEVNGEGDENAKVEDEVNDDKGGDDDASSKMSPDLLKLWKTVKDDPSDFTGWTYLLQYVDSNSELEIGREAYDAFLYRYPYCYGYWKKYADFEKRKGTAERCMMVFERGIKAIPLSADLWIHYLNHVKSTTYPEDFIRAQYERAVDGCGREWRSDKLWDHYVKWEQSVKNFGNVLKIYDRILSNPTQGLSHQFEMFREFVKEKDPKDILQTNEFLSIRKEVFDSLKNKDEENEDEKKKKKTAKKEDEGKEEQEGEEEKKEKEEDEGKKEEDDSDIKDTTTSTPKLTTEEENQAIKERLISSRKKVFKETEEKLQSRWKFEDSIKRPYFHMKPLERGQLKNWSDYLDFEMEEVEKTKKTSNEPVDESRVEILFERCLIACALYEEFWVKYIDWLSKRDGDHCEQIRSVFQRVCDHHLPDKIDIHLRRVDFEEKTGNLDKAVEILTSLQEKHPELLSFIMKRINLERRRRNLDVVQELFKACIEKKSGPVKIELLIKYARFLRLGLGDQEASLKVLEDAIQVDEKSSKTYLQILDIYLHAYPLQMSKIISVIDLALSKISSPKDVLQFSQRKVELLEDFGEDIEELAKARIAHNEALKKYRGKACSQSSSDDVKEENGKLIDTKTKKSNGSSSSSSSGTNSASYNAHHNNQYNQYGARYGSSNYNYNGSGGSSTGYGSYYQGYAGSYGSY